MLAPSLPVRPRSCREPHCIVDLLWPDRS